MIKIVIDSKGCKTNKLYNWEIEDRISKEVARRVSSSVEIEILRADDIKGIINRALVFKRGIINSFRPDFYISLWFNPLIQNEVYIKGNTYKTLNFLYNTIKKQFQNTYLINDKVCELENVKSQIIDIEFCFDKAHCGMEKIICDALVLSILSFANADEKIQSIDKLYRVRRSFYDLRSQNGAFYILENAVKQAIEFKLNVYDWNGICVFSYLDYKKTGRKNRPEN